MQTVENGHVEAWVEAGADCWFTVEYVEALATGTFEFDFVYAFVGGSIWRLLGIGSDDIGI